MTKNERIIRNTFEKGSVRDALILLTTCIHNAFPEFKFRGIEVTRLVIPQKTVEGKSWNHEFTVRYTDENGIPSWVVTCHRVSQGESADKTAVLDVKTLKHIG